jgi:hypothetical protein
MPHERLLQLREVAGFGHTLNRRDMHSFSLERQHETRADRRSVDQNGAGTADTLLTANVGPGKAESLA